MNQKGDNVYQVTYRQTIPWLTSMAIATSIGWLFSLGYGYYVIRLYTGAVVRGTANPEAMLQTIRHLCIGQMLLAFLACFLSIGWLWAVIGLEKKLVAVQSGDANNSSNRSVRIPR